MKTFLLLYFNFLFNFMDKRSPLFSATSALFRVASQTEGDERKYGRQNTTTFALSTRNFFFSLLTRLLNERFSLKQPTIASCNSDVSMFLHRSHEAKVLSTLWTTNFFSQVSWRHCFYVVSGSKTMHKIFSSTSFHHRLSVVLSETFLKLRQSLILE